AGYGARGRATRPPSNVRALPGAQMTQALEARDPHGAPQEELVAVIVANRDGPAAELVEALDRVDEVAEVRVAPHLAVGDDRHARSGLERDGIVHGAVLDAFELGVADRARGVARASLLQVGPPQEPSPHPPPSARPPPRHPP